MRELIYYLDGSGMAKLMMLIIAGPSATALAYGKKIAYLKIFFPKDNGRM